MGRARLFPPAWARPVLPGSCGGGLRRGRGRRGDPWPGPSARAGGAVRALRSALFHFRCQLQPPVLPPPTGPGRAGLCMAGIPILRDSGELLGPCTYARVGRGGEPNPKGAGAQVPGDALTGSGWESALPLTSCVIVDKPLNPRLLCICKMG